MYKKYILFVLLIILYCYTRGNTYIDALQQFVEKVVVFTQVNPGENLGPDCSAFFLQYSGLLASQGRLDFASRYIKGEDMAQTILRDRLYHAGTKPAGSRPPVFPFAKVEVLLPSMQVIKMIRFFFFTN